MSEEKLSPNGQEFVAPLTGRLLEEKSDDTNQNPDDDKHLHLTKVRNGELPLLDPSTLHLLEDRINSELAQSTGSERYDAMNAAELLRMVIISPKATAEYRQAAFTILNNGLTGPSALFCIDEISRLAKTSVEISRDDMRWYVAEVIEPARASFERAVSGSMPDALKRLALLMQTITEIEPYKWVVDLINRSLEEWTKNKRTVESWSEEELRVVAYAVGPDSLHQQGVAAWLGFLAATGVDPSKCANAWIDASYIAWAELEGLTRKDFTQSAEASMVAMLQIEQARPGAVKVLHEQFNLTVFGRYPVEALIRQYDERENTKSSYAVVALPVADPDGVFFQDKKHLSKVYAELDEHEVLTRYIEAENIVRLYVQLERLDSRYNGKGDNRILGGLIGGHGNAASIQFGFRGPQGIDNLRMEDFRAGRNPDLPGRSARMLEFAKRVKAFFVDRPSVGFLSCSTGLRDGIGQEISKFYDADVVAPTDDAGIEDVSISWDEGNRPRFSVKYDVGDSVTYHGGSAIET